MKRFIVLFLTVFLYTAQSFSQETKAEVQVLIDTNKIKVGEQAHLLLEITFPAGTNVIFPVLKDTLKGGISIVDIGEIDTSYDADDVKIKVLSQQLTITAWDSGFYPIEPFVFIVNGNSIKSEALLLEVFDVALDPAADIKDIKGIVETPFSIIEFFKEYWYYFIGTIVLLLILAFTAKYLRSRPSKILETSKITPSIPAHEEALNALESLEMQKLWQQDKVKEYYSELTHILRVYLERRFDIHALEQTSDEIILGMRSADIPEVEKKKVMHVLMVADMVKFAKEKPLGSENEAAITEVKKVVELTKVIEVKEDPTKEAEA
tara:strand:- start:4825 stop:5787 length:963 start_codon:yes stop_codon:yes gene_type:complete